ncbi:ABC transporter ATP-binding protein [Brevibacterium sp. HMSC08F02]|uniref:anchored repeat-type ABC transporter permease subunit n=1 Tax=Brevibacterium TaxID=1696 RepID=UPI000784BB86|nr:MULTISPECIES: anchored repeat-type ABC transporter permease subunit [Brevibacterium]OFT27069.1 ABC transporter ATP-binding protein [Brevibacterium sp. HMSC08F02]OFT99332.1 ABC transporter ATP-binding protein [Brevibacterium sp. HMSC22B09]
MTPLDFFTDLFNPQLAFLPRALAMAVLAAALCGIVGTYVVLRGMSFIGDAVSHAVFPGLATAFVIGADLALGGIIAGLVTSLAVAVVSQLRRLREDSVIGVFLVAAFGLGIVIISRAPGYAGSLTDFLFGSLTGVPVRDLVIVAAVGAFIAVLLAVFHQQLVAVSLDREFAAVQGIRVFWIDMLLYVCVTLAVVFSIQTVGNILVLGLLITPAAAARMLTERLSVMFVLAPTIGAVSAFIGLWLSWTLDTPVGGTIVLVLTAVFCVAWLAAPRHGLIFRLRSA